MKYSDQSYNLRIELDAKQCELTPAEIEKIEGALDLLRQPTEKFPVSDLYLTIEHHPRSGSYRVKAALQLPGRGLATGGEDQQMYPAVQQCIWRLVHKVAAYIDRLEGTEEKAKREKGTRQDVLPTAEVDAQAVEEAVGAVERLAAEPGLRKHLLTRGYARAKESTLEAVTTTILDEITNRWPELAERSGALGP
jgi:ribosome-associated translation inhibitor RaiA